MTIICILFTIMLAVLIMALTCITVCINDMTKEVKKIWSAIDDIGYALRPEEVPKETAMRVMINELKEHCKGKTFCVNCEYEDACPKHVNGCPADWEDTKDE